MAGALIGVITAGVCFDTTGTCLTGFGFLGSSLVNVSSVLKDVGSTPSNVTINLVLIGGCFGFFLKEI